MPASPNTVTIWVKPALGADRPRPSRVPKPRRENKNMRERKRKINRRAVGND